MYSSLAGYNYASQPCELIPLPVPDFSSCIDEPDEYVEQNPVIHADRLAEICTDVSKCSYDDVVILDARFDYEFAGGHIIGAINITSPEKLEQIYQRFKDRNVLIVCHCEYSRIRGPSTFNEFRKIDRKYHTTDYPNLTYPNVYVLEGGYKNFYKKYPDLCVGSYVKMRDHRYVNSMKRCHSAFKNQNRNGFTSPAIMRRSCSSQIPTTDVGIPMALTEFDLIQSQ